MIVGLKRASLVVVTALVLIFSMATTFLPWEDVKKEQKLHRYAANKIAIAGGRTRIGWKGEERHGIVVSLPREEHQDDAIKH